MKDDLSEIRPTTEAASSYEAPEIAYGLEDFEAALDFLSELDHQEGDPWAYLGDSAIIVLQKLTVVRHYLIDPSDQQRIGHHSLSEVFLNTFPEGLFIGSKKVFTATKLDMAISDLADMLGYQIPRIQLPDPIAAIIQYDDPNAVIDHDDEF